MSSDFATSPFSLRFARASESKTRMPERFLKRQTLERFATGLSLISAIRLSTTSGRFLFLAFKRPPITSLEYPNWQSHQAGEGRRRYKATG